MLTAYSGLSNCSGRRRSLLTSCRAPQKTGARALLLTIALACAVIVASAAYLYARSKWKKALSGDRSHDRCAKDEVRKQRTLKSRLRH